MSPFRYSLLIWAALLGYLIWNETPHTMTLIGGGMIVLSGIVLIESERRRRRPAGAGPA